jgi:phosphate transport system substrate-binding protein
MTTRKKLGTIVAFAALLVPSTLVGCDKTDTVRSVAGSDGSICGGQRSLKASGSSAQATAMAEFINAYTTACPGYTLHYAPSGSGVGVSEFLSGQTDFGGSESTLDPHKGEVYQARVRCGDNDAWDLPMVFGPIAISYNLPGVDSLVLDAPTAAMIFNGTVTSWDSPQITALNPGLPLPAQPIVVVYRSDQSGTTENFQNYLDIASDGAWGRATGKTFTGSGTKAAKGSVGAAAAVKTTPGSIAYNEWSSARKQNLTTARLITSAGGDPVRLSTETVSEAIADVTITSMGEFPIVDTSSFYKSAQPGAYPIVQGTYEIVCSQYPNPEVASAVRAFLTVALDQGQKNLAASGYTPIPDSLKSRLRAEIDQIS